MLKGESILYSLRNLNKRKSRSFLTILSIMIGIVTIFIFISFGYGLYNYMNELATGSSTDKIIVQAKGVGVPGLDDTFALTDNDLDAVKSVNGVYDVTGVSFKVAEIESQNKRIYSFVIAYDPDVPIMFDIGDIEIFKGRMLKNGESGKVLLGYNYLLDGPIFPKGLDINDKITINDEDLRIVGFLNAVGTPQDDSQVYVTFDNFDSTYGKNNYSYGWVMGRVDINDIDNTIERIENKLRKERDVEKGKEDFYVQSFQDLIESYSAALNIIVGFILLIAFISIIVSTINTANTMITSVLERYKEIGILKAIGAKNSEIFAIFLFESGFLGCVAGILGVLVGYGLTTFAGNLLVELGYGFLSPWIGKELVIGCILFATITGAISGVIPAVTASRINTVDALRYE